MNPALIPFESVIVPLTVALGLSLTVERILEFAQNVLEPLLKKKQGRQIPELARADRILGDLENSAKSDKALKENDAQAQTTAAERVRLREQLQKETDAAKRKEIKKKLAELTPVENQGEWDERVSEYTILVEPATDPSDSKTVKIIILQLLGFAVGIVLAHYSGIQLFNSILNALGKSTLISPSVDFLFTGLLIGGGSGPMHTLIRFVTHRRVEDLPKSEPAKMAETEVDTPKPQAPVVVKTPQENIPIDRLDIAYAGGVDRNKLEWIHRREANPDTIVYHHTAMSSRSTFEDVVRVIKSRKDSQGNPWATGYNCVITADGVIHPFCRWDRYGNHAAGFNMRSLGISFNGNFETDPRVPFSNPDGRMGQPYPTEVQLKAGARVVTLWTFLYPIEVDFANSIIPHNQISSKTCPGTSFPYDEFKRWVEFYRSKWEASASIQEQIEEFKLKPYLYI